MSTQDGRTAAHETTRYHTAARLGAALGAAILLAACGSGTAEERTEGGDTSSAAVAVHATDHPRLGKVLVDKSGKTVYFADQESDGTIRCVDDCLGVWFPVTTADGALPALSDGPALEVIHRSDSGKDQLALGGKPLYTFQLDRTAGDANGNDVEDDFGDTHFVWHAATVGGGRTPTPSADPGGGYSGGY